MDLILRYRNIWSGQRWPDDLVQGEIIFTEGITADRLGRGQGLRVWYIKGEPTF